MSLPEIYLTDLRLLWIVGPLFVLWAAVLWLLPRLRERLGWRERPALKLPSLAEARAAGTSRKLVLRRLAKGLRWLVLALLVVAFLRPQTGRTLTSTNAEGIDIVLVIDTSGSMEALDLDAQERSIARRRNRLQVAIDVVRRFISARENDQIGIVVFGEHAFTQAPLTLDHRVLGLFLDRLRIGMAGDATAIGDAVGIAVKRLRASPAESKVIVLLTDGRNNAGRLSPLTAAEVAKTFGVKIYAIGAGGRGQAPFLVETPVGRRLVYDDVEIDEETLRAMAETTGGAYFRAEDEAALSRVYEQIDELEKTELQMESFVEYDDRYRWLVAPAVLLLLLEIVLTNSWLRVLP